MATQCKSDVPNEEEEVKGWIKCVEEKCTFKKKEKAVRCMGEKRRHEWAARDIVMKEPRGNRRETPGTAIREGHEGGENNTSSREGLGTKAGSSTIALNPWRDITISSSILGMWASIPIEPL